MASSQRIETTTAQAASDARVAPHCPMCGSSMVVRALRHGDEVDGLYWGCRRPMVCTGTRKIRDPLVIEPTADASTQAIFEWERSRDRRGWVGGSDEPAPAAGTGGRLFGRFGRAVSRPTNSPQPSATFAGNQAASPLVALADYGYVVLDHRHVASAHAAVDHLVVGPSGVFVVDRQSWTGQISTSSDTVYVDGRQRSGATDSVVRATAAVEQVLGHELKALGVHVNAVIAVDGATNRGFEGNIGKVALTTSRSVTKVIRAGQPSLG
ncbi:MAG: nuclease-related domain-containing protein, partial [Candidatus Limnocylindrales bacterium]